jgi:DNA ligase (NAD+)
MEEKVKKAKGKFSGKIFVFTGSLDNISRTQAQDMIKGMGGRVSSSVSKQTDFVVVGKDPGSKYDTAKKLGVRILSEKEFKEMINGR